MSFPHSDNEVPNSDAQFQREFARKRKLENNEQQQSSYHPYPNKRRYQAHSLSSFKSNNSNEVKKWKQLSTQVPKEQPRKFSANDRLKVASQVYPDNNLEQSKDQLKNLDFSVNTRTIRNDYDSRSHWQQLNQQPKKTLNERFQREDVNTNTNDYWGQLNQEPRKYSANNRLKRVREIIQNKSSNSKSKTNLSEEIQTEHLLNSTTYKNINSYESTLSRNEDEFSDKLQTDASNKYNTSQASCSWRKEGNVSDGSLTEASRSGINIHSHSSSSPLSGNSQKKKSPAAPTVNLQERLNKIRNSTNSKSSYSNSKQQSVSAQDTVGGGWFKSVDVEGTNKFYNSHNRNNQQMKSLTAINSNRTNFITQNRQNVRSSINYRNESNNNRLLQNEDSTSFINNEYSASSSSTHEDEAMDWSYIQEKEIISDLEDLRRNFNQTPTPRTAFQEIIAKQSSEITHNKSLFKTTYVVIDTNIFLSHLNIIENIMKIKINGNTGIAYLMVLVPWIVIQELDYIKDRRSYKKSKLCSQAQKAIYFINDCLVRKLNLKGQSVRDAAQQDFVTSNFDDGILHCCMQIRDRNNRAILLSNDVNLRNKLITENFEAYNHRDIIEKLDPFHISISVGNLPEVNTKEAEKFAEMQMQMSNLLSRIIKDVTQEAYGNLWEKMTFFNESPPWTLQTCLSIFDRYWVSVFRMNLHENFLSNVKTLTRFLNDKVINTKILLDLALAVYIDLRIGYKVYSDIITEGIQTIENIHDK